MGRKATDLTGLRVGKLVVIKRSYEGRAKQGRPFWECQCDCGKTTIVSANHLKNKNIASCGCGQKINDLTGLVFGRWIVLERLDRVGTQQMWRCKCSCGTVKGVSHSSLVSGKSISCGCYHREEASKRLTTHNMTHTRIYRIYYDLLSRCNNSKNNRYSDYGGRGIKVCKEWEISFNEFYKWSFENGYSEEKSIDRINNDGPYAPFNCRWATKDQQSNNKRNTIYFEFSGVKKSLKEWVLFMGWNYNKYHIRHYRGYQTFRSSDVESILAKLKKE